MSVNIEHLSFAELQNLQTRVAERIAQKEVEEKSAVRDELEALARERGFDLKSLLEESGKKRTGKKAVAKYRNPNDFEQVWTGRGRKPKWVVEHLKNGGSLDDTLIEVNKVV